MTPLVALVVACAAVAAVPAPAAAAPVVVRGRLHADVVFVADDARVPLIAFSADQARTQSSGWLLVLPRDGAPPAAFVFQQEGEPASPLAQWPTAARGAVVQASRGGLVVGADDAGLWQDALSALPRARGTPAVPVSGPRALRVVLDLSSAILTETTQLVPATLIGSATALVGQAVLMRGGASSYAVVEGPPSGRGARGTSVRATALTNADVVSTQSACAGLLPTAVSAVRADVMLRLRATNSPACLGSVVVQGIEGQAIAATGDTAVRGLLVWPRTPG